jgi:hypothetical protein
MSTSNYIIITSINSPTEAVKQFSKINNHIIIVVGDIKTPNTYECPGVHFISIKDQKSLDFKLIKKLPYNHYCRKMIGYLVAIKSGADRIIDTDDDNIPYYDWGFPEFEGIFDSLDENMGFINIYKAFTHQKIWPRGLPLRLINSDSEINFSTQNLKCKIGIWQGLADEDPDVDAIYRLTSDKPCHFNKRAPLVCKKGTLSPFNTQNTLIRKELFPLLYLPTYVSFRYTDILRGLVAQPIMWLQGYELGFTQATVIQKRNPHDYFKDFISEIPMFETTEKAFELVSQCIISSLSVEDNMFLAYKALYTNNIVTADELNMLEAWLSDLSRISLK